MTTSNVGAYPVRFRVWHDIPPHIEALVHPGWGDFVPGVWMDDTGMLRVTEGTLYHLADVVDQCTLWGWEADTETVGS